MRYTYIPTDSCAHPYVCIYIYIYIYICIRVYTHTPEAKEKMQRRLLHGNIKGDGAGAKKGTHIDTKSREKKDLRLFVCVHVRVCWG